MAPPLLYEGEDGGAMKLKQLIFLVAVPLVAAMGARPGDGTGAPQPYVRHAVPAAGGIESPAAPAPAAELRILGADEAVPKEFLWRARPVVVFADTEADPGFAQQMAALGRDPAPLLAREVVVITDTDPAAESVWRRRLRPRGFSVLLLDLDGQVKQRKPTPRSVREITRAIDTFPLRRQETGSAAPP